MEIVTLVLISRNGRISWGVSEDLGKKIVRLDSQGHEGRFRIACKCLTIYTLKVMVLRDLFELSEPLIHFANASSRFLSISDEFEGDYEVIVPDYPA